jgi:REP element-mobilizing transposase RayT
MSRNRLDHPGSIHHVMARAVDGSYPFADADSCALVLDSIDRALTGYRHRILAWAVMPNHLHLLVRCSEESLSAFMRRLLVRFAMIYNKRHQRRGHLFQGKYRSILVEEGSYLLELIRYIHLNPVRAGLTPDLDSLASDPRTGHQQVISGRPSGWFDPADVLQWFINQSAGPREAYLDYLRTGLSGSEPEALETGNWLLGKNGLAAASEKALESRRYLCEGAILGSREFGVKTAVEAQKSMRGSVRTREIREEKIGELIDSVCRELCVSRTSLLEARSKAPSAVRARRMLVRALSGSLGLSRSVTARILGITPAAVTRILSHPTEEVRDSPCSVAERVPSGGSQRS